MSLSQCETGWGFRFGSMIVLPVLEFGRTLGAAGGGRRSSYFMFRNAISSWVCYAGLLLRRLAWNAVPVAKDLLLQQGQIHDKDFIYSRKRGKLYCLQKS